MIRRKMSPPRFSVLLTLMQSGGRSKRNAQADEWERMKSQGRIGLAGRFFFRAVGERTDTRV
jgi:hypothetical protein